MVTVVLKGNKEVSFRVEMIEKMCSGNSVIIHAPQGNTININGFTKAALVTIDGKIHQVQGTTERRRLTAGRNVQLYPKGSFFTALHGWQYADGSKSGRRRLRLEEDGPEGWASFALASEKALTAAATDANFCEGEPYFGIGTALVGEGELQKEASMLYMNDGHSLDRSMYIHSESRTVLYANCSDSDLNTCRSTGSYQWFEIAGQVPALTHCNDYTIFEGDVADVEDVRDTSDDTASIHIAIGSDETNVDLFLGENLVFEGEPCKELLASYPKFPTLEECGVVIAQEEERRVERRQLEATSTPEGIRATSAAAYHTMLRTLSEKTATPAEARRRLSDDFKHIDLVLASYEDATYEEGNAQVLVQECVFAFRGSQSISTPDGFQDWWANIRGAISKKVTFCSKRGDYCARFHSGFVSEFEKINKNEAFALAVDKCDNPTFVGHSLGGAIATLAKFYYDKGSAVTFGEPQVFGDDYNCKFDDAKTYSRYFHEDDPVPGDLLGAFARFSHGSTSTRIYEACRDRHWYSLCKAGSPLVTKLDTSTFFYFWSSCQKNSGWFDTLRGFEAHGKATLRSWKDLGA
jgi:hypothetical protein